MKDEIKEIINNMKEISSFEYTTDWFELNYKDTRILLDYITNLQQENEKKDAYIKYLQEYNPKYYKGEKFYGIEGDDENENT